MFLPEPTCVTLKKPVEDEGHLLKQLRETLIGDIERLVKLGQSEYISNWDHSFVYVHRHVRHIEHIPMDYILSKMRKPLPGEEPCRLGQLCQGNMLCRVKRNLLPEIGFTLPVFWTPMGQKFSSLCVLCIWLHMTKAYLDCKPHKLWTPYVESFKVTRFEYDGDFIRLIP